jgi:hypothetical protein
VSGRRLNCCAMAQSGLWINVNDIQ